MISQNRQVKRLNASDAAAFRELRLEGLRQHPEFFGSSLQEESALPFEWFAEKLRSCVVVGALDHSGAGLDGIIAVEPIKTVKQRHKGVVWGVYIRPECRGQGLGQALMRTLVIQCAGFVEELRLTVACTNDAAHQMYLKAGFIEFGFEERSLKLGNSYVAERHMMKQISSP
jgi:ribosomal protein S18 acetylase RimI-like enzyme